MLRGHAELAHAGLCRCGGCRTIRSIGIKHKLDGACRSAADGDNPVSGSILAAECVAEILQAGVVGGFKREIDRTAISARGGYVDGLAS